VGAIVLTLLIAGPWLETGFIFGTDWPAPRRFDFPTVLSNSAPLDTLLAVVSRLTTGELTGKLFVFGFLFTAALVAFRAAPIDGFVPRAVASTIYVFNPFVFGRLHYGQLFVLTGYALLPWVATRLRAMLVQPSFKAGLLLGISLALVGVASAHTLLISGVLVAALLVATLAAARGRLEYLKKLGSSLVVAVFATLAMSAYWLVPLVLGRGPVAHAVAGISSADLSSYAATPDPKVGLVLNLLGLYGFWAENTGRFASMKEFVPVWPLILAVLFVVMVTGAVSTFRHRRILQAEWATGLVACALIALFLEMGISSPVSRGFVTWLDGSLPLYRGMRDAGKWAELLALVYSQLTALGAAAILAWLRSRPWPAVQREWIAAVAGGLVLAVPLFYGNGLLFGMHGEIQPSSYPSGWYAADRALLADSHPGRTLFLPWHEYMTYTFVRNQNKVIVTPAPTFFSTPVVVNTNPELPGSPSPTDADQIAIAGLVSAGEQGHWAEVLASRGIKYVLLAREVDWKSFDFLDRQPNMALVGDYGSIVLYRNTLVP
jgi:hypothetical protein